MKKGPLSLLGMSEHENQVYLAMLSLGNTTAQEISRKTGIKRPTVYVYLEQMIRKGVVTKVTLGNKVYFKNLPVETIKNKVEEAYSDFQRGLPELALISKNTEGRPKIDILEGEEGVITAYLDMKNAKSIRMWSDLNKVNRLFEKHFFILAESIKKRETTTKEIISSSKESIYTSKEFSRVAGPTYSVRVSPVEGIMNDSIIYDDTVTLFRIHDFNMYVVRIKDSTIASTLSTLFDLAWKSSITIKDFNSQSSPR